MIDPTVGVYTCHVNTVKMKQSRARHSRCASLHHFYQRLVGVIRNFTCSIIKCAGNLFSKLHKIKPSLWHKGSLKRHEITHTGDKPFSYSWCDFKSSNNCNSKRNEKIHTGFYKPFSCSQCNYKCSDSGTLKRHERIHNGDKPFSCPLCDYKCSTSVNLKEHE